MGREPGRKIVENKAFFFGNLDIGRRDTPIGILHRRHWSGLGAWSRGPAVRRHSEESYQFDAGAGDDALGEFVRTTDNTKVFVRTDFNLNGNHRLTVRHNYIDAFNDVGFPTNILYFFPDNYYRISNNQNSTVSQLNSTFGSSVNELRITYQRIRDRRTNATNFPFVRVFLPDALDCAPAPRTFPRETRSIRTSSRSRMTSRR